MIDLARKIPIAPLCLISALLAAPAAWAGTDYAPMKPFEKVAGKTWRATEQDKNGKPMNDVSRWEFILGGKALEITHSLNEGEYGGRTIFFYDESAKNYVFHYFTTAGFHTQGTARLEGNIMTSIEKVSGHENIVEVRAVSTLGEDELKSTSEYVRKDGSTTPGHSFTYTPDEDAVVKFR